jgi:hypothetical protein
LDVRLNNAGAPILTLTDPTRADKVLSVATIRWGWSKGLLSPGDILNIGDAADIDTGYRVATSCTLVQAVVQVENNQANGAAFDLIVNGSVLAASFITIGGLVSGPEGSIISSLDINLNPDDVVNIKRNSAPTGNVRDCVLSVLIKDRF